MQLSAYFKLLSANLDQQEHHQNELKRLPSDSVLYSETKELLADVEAEWELLVEKATQDLGENMRDSVLRLVFSQQPRIWL